MWKPYGTIHSEVVENAEISMLRCANINFCCSAILSYGEVSDDYIWTVKYLQDRCLLLPCFSKDCDNKVYIYIFLSKDFTSIGHKMFSGYRTLLQLVNDGQGKLSFTITQNIEFSIKLLQMFSFAQFKFHSIYTNSLQINKAHLNALNGFLFLKVFLKGLASIFYNTDTLSSKGG